LRMSALAADHSMHSRECGHTRIPQGHSTWVLFCYRIQGCACQRHSII
jgi:hypothetical protein